MHVALLLASCAPTAPSVGDGTPADTAPVTDSRADTGDSVEHIGGSDTADADTDTDTDSDTDVDTETWPKACEDLYDPDVVQTFELTFSDSEWSGMMNDCANGAQTYRPMELTWNGETVPAMARLKGNWSWSCEKPQFVISFNEEDPDGRFHGLRKLMFDAPWYDRTLLHERIAFPIFAARGLPYSCANSARIVVNGTYMGLYSNLERIDHEYLERNFEDPEGNLYQGGSELKTNEDVGDTSDLSALLNAASVDELATLIDLDEAVAEWATEAMIPALDNYWAGVEINYYLYDYPGRGFLYLPYDLDISFGDSAYTDGSLIWPDAVNADPITYEHYGWRKEELFKRVLADRAWCDRFVEELELARAAYDPDALAAQVAEWDTQIRDSVDEDPNKPFSTTGHDRAVADLQDFFTDRAAVVDAWLAEGDHCPARW